MAGIAAILAAWSVRTLEFRLSEAELRELAGDKLLVSRSIFGANVSVARADLSLRDGSVVIDADIAVNALERHMMVRIVGSAAPTYRDGGFYVGRIRPIEWKLVSSELKETDRRAISKITGSAFWRDNESALVFKARDRGLEIISSVLERHPVYRLPNTVPGQLARLALGDVGIVGDHAVVEFHPWKAALWVLAISAGIAMAMFISLGVLRGT
jgi:hypothetical protein